MTYYGINVVGIPLYRVEIELDKALSRIFKIIDSY